MSPAEPSQGVLGCALIVDDAAVARRELCQALEGAGFKVTMAAEGVEGLWRARETVFDLVVTDVHMPTMDGLQFLADLKRLPKYEHTPVFVLTSDRSTERVTRGRELGATAWVIKPAHFPTLVRAVRDAVEAQRSAGAVREPSGG